MAKPSRGATRFAAGKKKAKKRYEPQPSNATSVSVVAEEPVEGAPKASGPQSAGAVLQFRPRQAAPSRSVAGKGGAATKAILQAVDYGYVYTDLKVIGGLAVLLFGGLVALSFVVH